MNRTVVAIIAVLILVVGGLVGYIVSQQKTDEERLEEMFRGAPPEAPPVEGFNVERITGVIVDTPAAKEAGVKIISHEIKFGKYVDKLIVKGRVRGPDWTTFNFDVTGTFRDDRGNIVAEEVGAFWIAGPSRETGATEGDFVVGTRLDWVFPGERAKIKKIASYELAITRVFRFRRVSPPPSPGAVRPPEPGDPPEQAPVIVVPAPEPGLSPSETVKAYATALFIKRDVNEVARFFSPEVLAHLQRRFGSVEEGIRTGFRGFPAPEKIRIEILEEIIDPEDPSRAKVLMGVWANGEGGESEVPLIMIDGIWRIAFGE